MVIIRISTRLNKEDILRNIEYIDYTMEWYHQWESEYRIHKEEHELRMGELDECLNCELCHPIGNEPMVFKKFWDALFKFEDTIIIYNNVTIKGVIDLLSMDNSEREDTIHKGKCRDIMDRITESIRYRIQPKMKEKGLRTIILVIVRDCIEGDLENEVFDRLIGNPELIEHKYILEDWDVERRFKKFWQWYKITSKEVKPLRVKMGAIKTFRELLYEEEGIATNEEKVKELMSNMEYGNIDIENVHEYHRNMVQKIIRIFIDTRGFIKEPEDSESEDSLESYEMKKNFNTSLYLRFERFRYWWNDKYEGKQIHTYHENDSPEWFEKMLSEGENLQEDTVRKLMDSMTFKDSEDIYTRNPIILRIDDGVIEWVVTDLKETMERTQKFKLVEIKQEEDNEMYDSEEEIEIIVEDKTWKLSEIRTGLRQLMVNPKEEFIREIMKFGIKEKIETGVLLTYDFIRYYIFQEGKFDKSEDIKEWIDLSTKICGRCNKQKLDYVISEEDGRCEECNREIREDEQDELIELKNNLEKLGYEIDVSEIQRIKNFGVNNRIIVTEGFIERYMGIIELEDRELRKEVHKWLNENTTWCERCEIRWMNDMFRLEGTICKDCEEEDIDEIDDRVKRLQKIFEDIGTMITEEELLRLTSMGYTDGEILDKEFIEIFQENKNESEKELKKKLDKLLKEQAGVMDSEESGEKSDNEESEEDNTDNSEKIGEILSPDEIWDGSDEDFEEEESENEIENVINTGGFGLNQNSDSNSSLNFKNSDTESEISDYNLQELFQENIVNMANEAQIRRIMENAMGLAPNALDNALGAGQTLADRIQTAGMGGIVGMPTFSGKEDEDINDWIRQFEIAFTVSGRPEGNVGGGVCRQNKANIAITCLRGIALQWYNEEKERVAANLVNWCDHNEDRNLKRGLIDRFTRNDVQRRKMLELTRIKQGTNESVEEYIRRFRSILRVATRGHALDDLYQVNYFIQGLDAMLGYHVRRRQEKNMEEILKEETNKYKGMNPIAKELQNKEVKSDEWDELINGIKRLEAHVMQRNEAYVMQRNGNDRRPIGNNNVQRNNMNWDRMTCYTCGRKGHTSRVCREGQRRSYGGNNKGSYSQNNQVNYLDEEYYGEGYNVYNVEYNDEYDGYNEGGGYDNYNNGFDGYEVNNYEDEERYDMFPVPPRKSERNKDKVMNDERDRRRNAQWQGQQQKAQENNKRGFTKEQLQKGYETRKNNNRCHNCGQQGHFARECTNEKVKLNRNIPNVGDFDPFEQFVNSSVPINWGQMMNERPEKEEKSQATRCNIIIEGKMIRALVDTGAGPSVITNELRKELNIPITKESNVVLTIADGNNIASLGRVEIRIEIDENLEIPLEFEVIDSRRRDLILGTDLLRYGIINMKEGLLTIEWDNGIYEIPIDFRGKKNVEFEKSGNRGEFNGDPKNIDDIDGNSSEESGGEDEYEEMEKEELLSIVKTDREKRDEEK
ncbi:ribonuclease H-like domain-containing protein [Rhizophagus irregularis DAOM 181602=DAOM 197198]|nr:ribonuclease H-like domain-containing protein [Rhizophagus irregularis DAOM 181602=DAOM 197198]